MSLRGEEILLMQKVPDDWRNLLTLLLSKLERSNQLATLLAMRYRRQLTHSAESWDRLLSALCRKVPFVGADGCVCFQGLLWCFPDPFIENFLMFLIRFHDVVSADSIDRFLSASLLENCPPFVHPLLQELSSILSKRCGIHLDNHSTENDEGKSVHSNDSVQISVDGKSRGACNGNRIVDSSVQSKEHHGTDRKITVLSHSSENLEPGLAPVKHTSKAENKNTNMVEKTEQLATDEVPNVDSFVIILDSSDEEEGAADKVYTEKLYDVGRQDGLECEESQEADGVAVRETADDDAVRETETSLPAENESQGVAEDVDRDACESGSDSELMTHVQKLKEALTSGGGDSVSVDLDFLLSLPPSQMSKIFAAMEWGSVEEDGVCGLIQGVVGLSDRLSHSASVTLVDSIVTPIYREVEETLSRQMMSCLSDLATAFPQQLVSVLCGCLRESPCSSVQSEVVTTLCKSWTSDTLAFFLRQLCKSDIQLDENLLTVVQNIVGKHPDLSSDLLDLVLGLLETGAAPLAKNAKYGRLVLNFVKFYKNQMNSSHSPSLQSIISVHSSVIRKSLRSVIDSLPA